MAEAPAPPEPSSSGSGFWNLRGLRWRVDLGVLPRSPASINDLRRAAADSRRGYATLRRRILIDPYLSSDGSKSPDLAMDNPLSQSPDSSWGRFFRNAELEKIVDQDLSRLYPGNNDYFRTPTCQSMLRRILISWCLGHPDYGYRQGMHELLAPLLYVLHVDLQHFSQVQGLYADYFKDDTNGMYFRGSNLVSENSFTNANSVNGNNEPTSPQRCSSLDELDLDTRDLLLLSDAYGAEGELGIILSERFMEHDAYCMFNSLMNGALGVVAMAAFFSPSPAIGSNLGLPPIIEASSALYHLLSIVDSSLHSHLVELGVEPQFFALRWLRVLFGREFLLKDLLVIWDEIFSSTISSSIPDIENDQELNSRVLWSPRGAYISAMAVSMLLHLRSSLLATENATTCLQRLVNFPENVDVQKLIEKAKSLHILALDANIFSATYQGDANRPKRAVSRGHSLSFGSMSPEFQNYSLPESYWEEKWRVMNKTDELPRGSTSNMSSKAIVKDFSGEKLGVCTAESDLSIASFVNGEKDVRSSISRRLSDDFQESDLKSDLDELRCKDVSHTSGAKATLSMDLDRGIDSPKEHTDQTFKGRNVEKAKEPLLKSENSLYPTVTGPRVDYDKEADIEKNSVTSTSSVASKLDEAYIEESSSSTTAGDALPRECEVVSATSVRLGQDTDGAKKRATVLKERKMLSGKFQWFRKLSRGSGEVNFEKVGKVEAVRSVVAADDCKDISAVSTSDGLCNSVRLNERIEVGDKKVNANLRTFGKSILMNIQVIEAVFQQALVEGSSSGNSLSNILEGREQAAAVAALDELRKISNLLSEM